MVKGFKDPTGKFHPITQYKSVRRKRDSLQGIMIERKKRFRDKTKQGKEIKRWVAFNPSSSETEWWTSDKLNDLKWIIQDESTPEDTPIVRGGYGRYTYAGLEIFDITKHPKLLEEVKTWDD